MSSFCPVVVIPAFRRPAALRRLLSSVGNARLPHGARIIISLEGGAHPEVDVVAQTFAMSHRGVEVKRHEQRLGLRDHIVECGDYAYEHGSVIVLEEDLHVDPHFHFFAATALEFYAEDPRVAGVALYSPAFSEFAGLPFQPLANGWDVYAAGSPCSWGQAWSAAQWHTFRKWYETATESDVTAAQELPPSVRGWPETSWKKYFAAYMASTDRVFIYPYQSYSTNCADSGGTHVRRATNAYQTPMADPNRTAPCFRFCPPGELSRVEYDPSFEPVGEFLLERLGLRKSDVQVDLYGTKTLEQLRLKEFALTRKPVTGALARFPYRFRPIELNVEFSEADVGDSALSLARSTDVLNSGPTLHDYEYHLKFSLRSLRLGLQIAQQVPTMLSNRISGHFSSLPWLKRHAD